MILGTDTEKLLASVWFSMTSVTSSGILNLRIVPFSTCCWAIVLFTSIYQMHVMLNASIENVIKPDITSLLCEADSAGRPMMPMRVGWGSRWAVCVFVQQQEAMCPSPSAPRRLSVIVHKCPLLPTHCRVTCCSSEEKHSAAHRTMT